MGSNNLMLFIGISIICNSISSFFHTKDINSLIDNQNTIMDIYRSLDKSLIDLTHAHCELLEDHCELKKELENLQKKVDLLEQSVYNEV